MSPVFCVTPGCAQACQAPAMKIAEQNLAACSIELQQKLADVHMHAQFINARPSLVVQRDPRDSA